MNTKPIPIIMSLSAAGISCIISISQGVDFATFLARLILAVILFYFVGIVVGIFLLNAFGPPRVDGEDDDIFDNELPDEEGDESEDENDESEKTDEAQEDVPAEDVMTESDEGFNEPEAGAMEEGFSEDSSEETDEEIFESEEEFSQGLPQENIEDENV